MMSSFILFLAIIAIALGSFIQSKVNLPLITWWINNFEREKYRKRFPAFGMLMFFIGCFIVVRFFSKDIALASIVILTLGDSITVIVGKKGKLKHFLNKNRKFEGTLAAILFAFLGAMFFVNPFEAFIASSFALGIECLDFRYKPDDNILVPVLAALVILCFRLLL